MDNLLEAQDSRIIGGIWSFMRNNFFRNKGNTVITVESSEIGSAISNWKIRIESTTTTVNERSRCFLTGGLTAKLLTIWAEGYDTIELMINLTNTKLNALVVKLTPTGTPPDDDGKHKGVAKHKNEGSLLYYYLSPTHGERIATIDQTYCHHTQRSGNEATIGFAKSATGNDIFTLKIKKKKKNSQVDVYLDDANPIDG